TSSRARRQPAFSFPARPGRRRPSATTRRRPQDMGPYLDCRIGIPTSSVTFLSILVQLGWSTVLMTTKEERREAFGGVLSATLARVVDFLKFAETKNAALLTFASAWTFASINMLTGDRAPAGIIGGAFWVALILFSAAAVVAIVSFLPKLNLHALHRDPTQPR